MMEFIRDYQYKAKKRHFCECCGKPIEPGEEYVYQAGKYEGEFFYRHYCLFCDAFIRAWCWERVEDEFEYDWLYEDTRERYCYGCREIDDCSIRRDKILQCPIVRHQINYEMKLGVE